jgi:hypothetical protein
LVVIKSAVVKLPTAPAHGHMTVAMMFLLRINYSFNFYQDSIFSFLDFSGQQPVSPES